ncbi:mandelate racemase/muconate lactonizing enzyme family protein [Rhodopseudomonas sp. HC1]|uniref:mandelate racemase/muconate lactonizing enzyme family protein n=1 Tax=Rhodopseudomonas infernalis TaxID=2897386 RepID=UPI001EE85D84|nr:mandelate racemase/muconate lactonizing enzyme family protein [Rhodopseudomonas infernalis]MCG6206962.1 mandelate racemase/muconate lactonizing enzyme family protein [Rhodopseudomonas infernalis]
MTTPFTIRSLQAFAYRYPLTTPVVTSFGRMTSRPAVFVRVEDDDGVVGWGEAWCNFPSPGAEHRARLLNETLAPLVIGQRVAAPAELFEHLTQATAVLALQSGEAGPFAQTISGIDLAVWDLFARRQATPLWRLLGGAGPRIQVYASGLNPTGTEAMAEAALRQGYRALKLKVGFGAELDGANLAALRRLLGDGPLAADANQAWSVDEALALAPRLAAFDLAWLEEPIRADRPRAEWQQLRAGLDLPLAAGENITSRGGFGDAISGGELDVIQPDIAKWGGLSLCADIAGAIRAAGKRFCPHYLGGGLGLLASAHLLAGIGGDGLLEVDCNHNPLRDRFCGPVATVSDGWIELSEAPGIGLDPDLEAIAAWRTA